MSKIVRDDTGYIVAIDPGNEKTGMALLSLDGELIDRCIVPTKEIGQHIQLLLKQYMLIDHIVCGNGTNHKHVYPIIESICSHNSLTTSLIDESYTTEIARKLYWQYNPPKGWRKFLPTSALFPPEPVDDLTAYIIGKRYIDQIRKK